MEHLAEQLRRADPDRYLAALYAPGEKRASLFALYAFNAEIARIRDQIREPALGEIRLQWWEDALMAGAAPGGAPSGHPLAELLSETIRSHQLPLEAFRAMIDARRFDLYNDPMPSVTDLEGYCGETSGALIQLASLVLDPKAAAECGEIAGHAGCALAITGLIALLPRHRARQQCYIPQNLLAAAGASPADLFAEEPGEAAERAVAAMIALGSHHYTEFETRAGKIPQGLRSAYLPLSLVRPWLAKFRKAGRLLFQHSVELSPMRRQAAMLRRGMLGWNL